MRASNAWQVVGATVAATNIRAAEVAAADRKSNRCDSIATVMRRGRDIRRGRSRVRGAVPIPMLVRGGDAGATSVAAGVVVVETPVVVMLVAGRPAQRSLPRNFGRRFSAVVYRAAANGASRGAVGRNLVEKLK